MFDFEKLEIYQLVKQTNTEVLKFVLSGQIKDDYLVDQWKKATLGMQLNLAEGTGRFSSQEKKHFFIISRSSAFECVALLDVLKGLDLIDPQRYESFYTQYEQISKMLLGLYRNVKEE
ncbi:MAG TPA: four helix bundle protein [Saprospiraceae bacterium]|nr:four helix bundle protein [Saprospiraceae bacterium]